MGGTYGVLQGPAILLDYSSRFDQSLSVVWEDRNYSISLINLN